MAIPGPAYLPRNATGVYGPSSREPLDANRFGLKSSEGGRDMRSHAARHYWALGFLLLTLPVAGRRACGPA